VAQIKRFRNRVTLRSRDRKPIGFEFFLTIKGMLSNG